MARLDSDSNLSGSIGPVITYKVNGKTYIRSRPAKVRQPNTPAQLLARDKFRQASLLAKRLYKQYPLLGLDDDENRDKSGYHEMLGHLRKGVFQEGVSPVRWVWERLSFRISTPTVADFQLENQEKESIVRWDLRNEPKDGFVVLIRINTNTIDAHVFECAASELQGHLPIFDHEMSDNHAFYAVFKKQRNGKPKVSEAVFLGLREG